MAAFAELGMLPELATAVEEMGWMLPTDIQQEGIPAILGGADVCMAAETGSGKTGAFCLPVIQVIWETLRDTKTGKKKVHKFGEEGWNLNVFDRDPTLSVDREAYIAESSHPKFWSGGRANKGVFNKGKYYYEATIVKDGLCRVGWATPKAQYNLGTCSNGYGFGGTGKKSYAGNFDDYGESFERNDVIGCYLDLDSHSIHFAKNGKEFEIAFKISQSLVNASFYPAFVLKNSRLKLNFGHTAFKFPPKKGYVGLTSASPDCVESSPKNGLGGATADPNAERPNSAPLCIILEPTMELARQTHEQIVLFSKKLDSPTLRAVLVGGGIPIAKQIKDIEAGVDVVTCTPGRAFDLIDQEKIKLTHVRFFVLDEADSLVDGPQNCSRKINNMYQTIPRFQPDGSILQMIVCSATLHNLGVERLAATTMHFPQWIDLKGQDTVPDTVHQIVCPVDPVADKSWIRLRSKSGNGITTDGIHSGDQLRPNSDNAETLSEGVKVLKGEYVVKAIRHFKMDQCIIFCRTKIDCDNMEQHIFKQGPEWTCVCLHGDRNAEERTENLRKFKSGEVKYLICTDVAARGIDVHGVPFVINVTLPSSDDISNYVHRIGRVGRADRMGLAISFVSTVPEKVWYHKCRNRVCKNTALVNKGGCAIWFSEKQSLAEIEEHLGVTVARVSTDFDVPVDEYDGKVVYGRRRANEAAMEVGLSQAAVELTGIVRELNTLERQLQLSYWKLLAS
uniref:ATP-dependent RNA helicase n=1 Tax=Panagrellus redivivus TaxID=6233 RepID=A0A7E4UWC7_PANRE